MLPEDDWRRSFLVRHRLAAHVAAEAEGVRHDEPDRDDLRPIPQGDGRQCGAPAEAELARGLFDRTSMFHSTENRRRSLLRDIPWNKLRKPNYRNRMLIRTKRQRPGFPQFSKDLI